MEKVVRFAILIEEGARPEVFYPREAMNDRRLFDVVKPVVVKKKGEKHAGVQNGRGR